MEISFRVQRHILEEQEKWRELMEKVPYLQFPPEWKVRAVPPFSGALVRYHIKKDSTPKNNRVSIYLDWFDNIGFMGQPYWEVHPIDGDCERCLLNETERLLELISISLEQLEKENAREESKDN